MQVGGLREKQILEEAGILLLIRMINIRIENETPLPLSHYY